MSVAGGVSKAVDRAFLHGCEALQIFSRNASQWHGKPLDPLEVRAFRRRIDQTGITPVVSHASYLINLATTFSTLRQQSIAAFVDELDRAETLGLMGVTRLDQLDSSFLRPAPPVVRPDLLSPFPFIDFTDKGY